MQRNSSSIQFSQGADIGRDRNHQSMVSIGRYFGNSPKHAQPIHISNQNPVATIVKRQVVQGRVMTPAVPILNFKNIGGQRQNNNLARIKSMERMETQSFIRSPQGRDVSVGSRSNSSRGKPPVFFTYSTKTEREWKGAQTLSKNSLENRSQNNAESLCQKSTDNNLTQFQETKKGQVAMEIDKTVSSHGNEAEIINQRTDSNQKQTQEIQSNI